MPGQRSFFSREAPNVDHSTRSAFSGHRIGFKRGCIRRVAEPEFVESEFAESGQFPTLGHVSVQRTAHEQCERRGDPAGSERKLATAESLEVHETTLPPGAMPHPAHHHVHSEMWLIREGTVQLTINGKSHVMGPGSVGFVHSNDEHGIKNVGTTPATYFVVAVGPGADA